MLVQYAAIPDEGETAWSQIDKACIKDQFILLSYAKEKPKGNLKE
jgi:hypothetical protein